MATIIGANVIECVNTYTILGVITHKTLSEIVMPSTLLKCIWSELFSHICEMYPLKYTFPRFEMFRVKIDYFTGLQSCAILPSKVVWEWVRVKPKISYRDVICQ